MRLLRWIYHLNCVCWYSGKIGGLMLILFSNGHGQIELSSQPYTDIISTQPHAGRLSWILGRECGKKRERPAPEEITPVPYRHSVKIRDIMCTAGSERCTLRRMNRWTQRCFVQVWKEYSDPLLKQKYPHCKNTFLHIKAQCYQLNVPSPRIAGLNLRGSWNNECGIKEFGSSFQTFH